MFGTAYFGTSYFGPSYFGPGYVAVIETAGGAGHPKTVVVIYNRKDEPVQLEKDTLAILHKKVEDVKKETKGEVSQEAIELIAKAMESQFNAKSNMATYTISYQEALLRYQSLMLELAEMLIKEEEDAMAILLLMSMI